MLSTSPQNSTTWHSWTLNPENPVGGANYIKEAVSPEAAQTNGFSHRIGVLLFRGLFIAASLVYWYSRDTKPTSSAKDVIVGIGLALSFLISTAHFIISSKETQQRLLWSCNVGNTVCQVAVLVCLFYSANKSQSSPLHLASLLALMVAETTAVRSIFASTIVGVLLLAIDPSSRTDYSAVVVSIVGSFVVTVFLSCLLWYNSAVCKHSRVTIGTVLRTQEDLEIMTPRSRGMSTPSSKGKGYFGSAFGADKQPVSLKESANTAFKPLCRRSAYFSG